MIAFDEVSLCGLLAASFFLGGAIHLALVWALLRARRAAAKRERERETIRVPKPRIKFRSRW